MEDLLEASCIMISVTVADNNPIDKVRWNSEFLEALGTEWGRVYHYSSPVDP